MAWNEKPPNPDAAMMSPTITPAVPREQWAGITYTRMDGKLGYFDPARMWSESSVLLMITHPPIGTVDKSMDLHATSRDDIIAFALAIRDRVEGQAGEWFDAARMAVFRKGEDERRVRDGVAFVPGIPPAKRHVKLEAVAVVEVDAEAMERKLKAKIAAMNAAKGW